MGLPLFEMKWSGKPIAITFCQDTEIPFKIFLR
jgi:hypothetical protein